MRTFIAVELNKDLHNKLKFLQDKLKSEHIDVKWVKPENIHLTLKFLGQTDDGKIESIKNIMDNLASKFRTFSLEVSNLGAFPNLRSPRVIWIGVHPVRSKSPEVAAAPKVTTSNGTNPLKGNTDIVSDIVGILEEKLEKLDFPKEKKVYQSHITIGRIRSSKNLNILRESLQDNFKFKTGTLRVTQIALIQSTLTPSGPIYTPIYTAKLI